jgi:hypothetical protein
MDAALGSTSDRIIREKTDFPVPCSPLRTSTGYGPRAFNAATSHAIVNIKSPSLCTFKNPRSSSIMPPRSGSGSERMDEERKNFNGGLRFIDQPAAVTFTAAQPGLPRSMNTLPSCWPTLTNGSYLRPSFTARASKRPFRNWLPRVQFIEQSLGLFEIERVETVGKLTADQNEQSRAYRGLMRGSTFATAVCGAITLS